MIMEGWNQMIGQNIKLIFEDGENHYSKKQGKVISTTTTHLLLNINDNIEGFEFNRIIRFEVVK